MDRTLGCASAFLACAKCMASCHLTTRNLPEPAEDEAQHTGGATALFAECRIKQRRILQYMGLWQVPKYANPCKLQRQLVKSLSLCLSRTTVQHSNSQWSLAVSCAQSCSCQLCYCIRRLKRRARSPSACSFSSNRLLFDMEHLPILPFWCTEQTIQMYLHHPQSYSINSTF